MIKDIINNNDRVTGNERTLALLHRDFPQCFNAEGHFDLEAFKSLVGETVPATNEGYSLNFLGKSYANLIASTETTTVIVPDNEHNELPENADSQNIYISGDNLDALKHLRNSYSEAVKCIYIDPPYNTGSDGFVYNDTFNYTSEQLQERLGISEKEASRVLDMTTRGSASHSAWLAFMFPRLLLAKDLLAPDGVIFISIDNNEQANLKVICDAIFGEENFLTMLSRRTKVGGGSAANYFALENDYVMVWAKSIEDLPNLYAPFDEKYLKRYSEEDEKGRFFWDTMERSCTATTPYKIEAPDGTILSGNWFRSEQRFLNDKANGEVRFLKKAEGEWSVQFKQRLPEGKKIRTFLNDNNFKSSQDDLDELGMGGMFEHPKPVYLINYLLQGCLSKDSIVLDFFSGSATTAQAVMRMNTATDGGLRKFIMVQWAEKTKENSEARNAGYNTIDEIGQERIRRAAKKIKEENPLFAGDLGFKHYTLVEPSDQTFAKLEEFNPRMMFTDDNILNEFGRDTVLRTWLVRDGYGFNAEVETLDLDGYEAYVCGRHLYFVNPGLGMDSKHIIALVDLYNSGKSFKPENVVIFGYSFTYTETEELKKNLLPLRDSIKNLKVNLDIRY